MFSPTNPDESPLSPQETKTLARWFEAMLIFYASVMLIGFVELGVYRDSNNSVQATADQSLRNVQAIPVSARR